MAADRGGVPLGKVDRCDILKMAERGLNEGGGDKS